MSTCFNCDAELETTLPGATKYALCDECRKGLQAKVDRAVQSVEADLLYGVYRKRHHSRSVRTVIVAGLCTVLVVALLALLLVSFVRFS